MNERNLQQFKKQLTEWLSDLELQADRTVSALKDFDLHRADPVDHGTEETWRSFSLRIHNRENRLILKIHQSLRDIEEGSYGICENCGEDIGLRRLQARPVARHCIRCKTQMETMERLLEA